MIGHNKTAMASEWWKENEWMDESMDGWIDEWKKEIDESMDGWIDEWKKEIDESMDG